LTLNERIRIKYAFDIAKVIKIFNFAKDIHSFNSNQVERMLEKIEVNEECGIEPDLVQIIADADKKVHLLQRASKKIKGMVGLNSLLKKGDGAMSFLAERRFERKRKKYFRTDHPLIKDWKFKRDKEKSKYKYFLEDNLIVKHSVKHKNINLYNRFYDKELKKASKLAEYELSSPDNEMEVKKNESELHITSITLSPPPAL
jgi:hypothetical protein